MSIVCCLEGSEACICPRNPLCGGIHFPTKGCPTHRPAVKVEGVECKTIFHEAGQRPVRNV